LVIHNSVFKYDSFDIYQNYHYNDDDLLKCYNENKNTNLFTIPNTKIHHGHPIVKAEICYDIDYNENMTIGEDGNFCQRISSKYGNDCNFTKPLLKYLN